MSRAFLATLLVAANLSASVPVSSAAGPPFPDMQWSWYGYQDSVAYLQAKGSIEGYPDGNFHPKDIVNRAEFLKLVFRSRGNPEPVSGECFADVPEDAWFAPFVCAAKRRGIVNGYRVGVRSIFRPEQPILFAEAVKMVLLAYGNDIKEGSGSQWFAPYVEELDRLNVLSSSSYVPWQPISRERAADLIARFVKHSDERAIGNLSPGCGKSQRSPATVLPLNGVDRTYLFTPPRDNSPNTASPLIVAFHGRTNSNERVRGYFGLDRAADTYAIAYPSGIPNGNGSYSWSNPGDKASQLRDIAFFDAIVKEVSESRCIDMDRIYVVGHSLGAWMANSVACVRGGVVRASATVGGSTTMGNCNGPSAALILNNPKDTLSPHKDSERMRDVRLQSNVCGGAKSDSEPREFSCEEYAGCGMNPVLFCPHTIDTERDGTYYPHVWPRSTGQEIVRFFDGLR